MNTITVNKKMGCGITLHIHYNHEGYFNVICGKNGECKNVVWYIISEVAKHMKREELIALLRKNECEGGAAGGQSCFDFIARLLQPPKEEKK